MSTTSNASEGRPGPRGAGAAAGEARAARSATAEDGPPRTGRAPTATAPRPDTQDGAARGGTSSASSDAARGATPRGVAGAAPRADASAGAAPAAAEGELRQVRLTVAHVNAWTVLRISFLLSVALGVVLVVAVAVVWGVLDGIGVFESVNGVIREVVGTESSFDLMELVGLTRVLALTVVVAVVDVVLLTLLATLGAVLYNICAALVGGVHLTLTDD